MTKHNHYFKRIAGFVLSAAVLFSTAAFPAASAAAAEPVVVEDFDTITEISQNSIFEYKPSTDAAATPETAYARIEEGALHLGKTVNGAHELRINLAEAIGDRTDYTVSFDFAGLYSGSSTNIKLGACFAFENAANTAVGHPNPPAQEAYQHVLQWWGGPDKTWDKTDMMLYDLSKPVRMNLVVKGWDGAQGGTVDVYINGKLEEEGLPYRQSPFNQLHFQMNGGVRGEIVLDNLTVAEGEDVISPPLPEGVLYTQDFSKITDIAEDPVLGINPGTTDAVAVIENGALRFGKTQGGDKKEAWFFAEFADRLSADRNDYLVSFDIRPALSAGGSFNLYLGGCIVIRPQEDNRIVVGWHDGTAWHEEDKTPYGSPDGSNIKLVVHGRGTMDVYVNNTLVQAGVPQRGTASFTKLNLEMSKNTKGDIYLDNFLLTTDTHVDEEPLPPPEEIENPVTESDVPAVGAPAVAKEDFELYLAIGQSNMAGRASLEAKDRIFIPNAYLFNGDGQWETAQAQYVNGKWQGINRYSTVQKAGALQGLSPAFYFAKTLAEQVGSEQKKIGIISNARGDTSLAQWQKGYTATGTKEDFDLYEEAVSRARAAMEKGTLKGIIWHQGCADLGTDPAEYISAFSSMVQALRTDLGVPDLPVIIGEIPGFGKDNTTVNNRMRFNQQCIARIPDSVPNCWAVSAAGSRDIGDRTHFDAASQRRMGSLYGQTALERIYGVQPARDNLVPLENVTASAGADTAGYAADAAASIQTWDDPATYWAGEAGAEWTAEFGDTLTLTELRSYFLNPYNYVVQYKIYLRQDGGWTLAADRSDITAYETVDVSGAVVDSLEDTPADAVKIEITGILDYDKKPADAVAGCHEFEVYSSDVPQGTRVSFRGYGDRAEIPVGEADTLELTAASPSGIRSIRVYADDALLQTLTEAPYLLDISALGICHTELRAVAEANDGSAAEAVLDLTIAGELDHSIIEDSAFETDGGTGFKSGIMTYPQRGYVKVGQIDSNHGDSLLVGIEKANEDYSSGNLPYINIPLGGIADEFSVFCDLYVDAKENSGDKKLTLYQASGNEVFLLQFKDQLAAGGTNVNYETGRWYSFRIDIDVAAHRMTVFRDGVQVGSAVNISDKLVSANYIRLYGPRNDTVPSYTAIDNLRVVKYFRIPAVVSVGENGLVSAGADSFTIQMDDALYGGSITPESVWLLDNAGSRCSLREAKWSEKDRTITVSPVRKLASGSSYSFILGGAVELSAGVPIRYPVRAAFRTAAEGVEIASAQLTEAAGMKKAVVTLYNATEAAAKGFVVMTLWDGDAFCGMAVQPCAPAAGGTEEITLTHAAPAGASAEICVYDSLTAPRLLSGSVYRGK